MRLCARVCQYIPLYTTGPWQFADLRVCARVYIYIYICVCVCVCIYIYIAPRVASYRAKRKKIIIYITHTTHITDVTDISDITHVTSLDPS